MTRYSILVKARQFVRSGERNIPIALTRLILMITSYRVLVGLMMISSILVAPRQSISGSRTSLFVS